MADEKLPLAMLQAVALLVIAVQPAVAVETVYLQPRGWPPIQCNLTTQHAASGEPPGDEENVDFWLRGRFSGQLYGCRLDVVEGSREKVFAAARGGQLYLLAGWTVNLRRYFYSGRRMSLRKDFRLYSATRTPIFTCVTDGEGSATALPTALFPLRVRRDITGADAQWQGCVLVSENYYDGPMRTSDGLLTLAFGGGAPIIVCGIGDSKLTKVPALELRGILGVPFVCFFATYIDFPGIMAPKALDVFQKQIVGSWATNYSASAGAVFPSFHCWSADANLEKPFDFDVQVDGKHAHRCRFRGNCPQCDEDTASTTSSMLHSSERDTAFPRELELDGGSLTTVDSLLASQTDSSTSIPDEADGTSDTNVSESDTEVTETPLFLPRLCKYLSQDADSVTHVSQIRCFG